MNLQSLSQCHPCMASSRPSFEYKNIFPLHCYSSLHIDLTVLHISVEKQHAATFIYHAIAIFVPATNMLLKCQR